MKKIITSITVALLAAVAVNAQNNQSDGREFTVSRVVDSAVDYGSVMSVVPLPPIVPVTPSTGTVVPYPGTAQSPINPALESIDKIINIGKKVFDIIKEGEPVVNITVDYATAYPEGEHHWSHLQNWSAPAQSVRRLEVLNGLGRTTIDVTYMILYTYGGDYYGRGKFLTAVSIQPLSVRVDWGWKLDLACNVPDMTVNNIGTSENPIAALQLNMEWRARSLNELSGRNIFYITGDGNLTRLGVPSRVPEFSEMSAAQQLEAGF